MHVTLMPGVGADRALRDLRDQRDRLSALGSRDKFEALNGYLRWASDAAQALASSILAADVERLILTRRHWALCAIDPAANDAVGKLVHGEISDRYRELGRAIESLDETQRRWSGLLGKIVVADTNVYLHHEREFERIDWGSTAGAAENEAIQLIVPILIVDELDRAKRGRTEVRSRARTTLRMLSNVFSEGKMAAKLGAEVPDVMVHLLLDPPMHERLGDWDGELIDRTLALDGFTKSSPQMVTFDTGMAFRARAAGLQVRHLYDE